MKIWERQEAYYQSKKPYWNGREMKSHVGNKGRWKVKRKVEETKKERGKHAEVPKEKNPNAAAKRHASDQVGIRTEGFRTSRQVIHKTIRGKKTKEKEGIKKRQYESRKVKGKTEHVHLKEKKI